MEDGGFTLVSRGNNRRGRAKPLDGKAAGRALAAAEGIAESSAADEADIARRIDAAVLELRKDEDIQASTERYSSSSSQKHMSHNICT